jgi:hypothetical protein
MAGVSETFYISLCVTILLLGIVYWFWTQVQYLQRKVNLLDNVVYEIKTLMSNLPGSDSGPKLVVTEEADKKERQDFVPATMQESYAPPPESIAGDLEAERNASEEEFENFSGSLQMKPMPMPEDSKPVEVPDELQPGGLAQAASGNETKNVKVETDASIESPLSSLGLKDLRRMAEAQGIPGFNELKKKDLIRALRDKVSGLINNSSQQEAQPQIISFDMIDAPTLE